MGADVRDLLLPIVVRKRVENEALGVGDVPILLRLQLVFLPIISFLGVRPLQGLVLRINADLRAPVDHCRRSLKGAAVARFLRGLIFRLLRIIKRRRVVVRPVQRTFLGVVLLRLLLMKSVGGADCSIRLPLMDVDYSVLRGRRTIGIVVRVRPIGYLCGLGSAVGGVNEVVVREYLPRSVLSDRLRPFIRRSFLCHVLAGRLLVFLERGRVNLALLLMFGVFR